MSFSQDLKYGIVNNIENYPSRINYIIMGAFQSSARLDSEDNMTILTENAALLKMIIRNVKSENSYDGDISISHSKVGKRRARYKLKFSKATTLLGIYGIESLFEIPPEILESKRNRKDYITGFFLGSGSVTDPNKSYHMEFVCSSEKQADALRALLRQLSINTGKVGRSRSTILYVKDSGKIADILSIMGASVDRFSFENTIILKDLRNKANRISNCDIANLDRVADMAKRQRTAIKLIDEMVGLDSLDEKLRQAAELRLAEPEMSLKELGLMMSPPIGKSGMNHRLNKIERIAATLEKKKGKEVFTSE